MKDQKMSRRDLLKTSGAAFAGAVLLNAPGFGLATLQEGAAVVPYSAQLGGVRSQRND